MYLNGRHDRERSNDPHRQLFVRTHELVCFRRSSQLDGSVQGRGHRTTIRRPCRLRTLERVGHATEPEVLDRREDPEWQQLLVRRGVHPTTEGSAI